MNMLILACFHRELKLYFRKQGEWIQPIIFFIIMLGIFAMIFGDSQTIFTRHAPAMLWICLVLGIIFSENTLFFSDKELGILPDLLLNPHAIMPVIFCKLFTHTLLLGMPLLLIALLSAFLFDVKPHLLPGMALTFLISLPTLSLVVGMAEAITLGLKRGGLLLGILVLPLMAPVILFGCAATQAVYEALPLLPHLALLLAIFLVFVLIAPLVCLFALKVSVEC